MRTITVLLLLTPILLSTAATAQTNWNKDGNSYTTIEDNSIVEITLPAMTKTTLVSADQLAPLGLAHRESNRDAQDVTAADEMHEKVGGEGTERDKIGVREIDLHEHAVDQRQA